MLTSKKKVCMGKDHLLYQTSCESCTNPGFSFLFFSFLCSLVVVWCKIEFGESSFVIKRGPDHPLGKESPI